MCPYIYLQQTTAMTAAVQNTAAQVLIKTRRADNITPVLRSLHWLPVCQKLTLNYTSLFIK